MISGRTPEGLRASEGLRAGVGAGLALVLLAACSGEKRAATPEAAAPVAPPPAAVSVGPAVVAPPARPVGADAVDAALKAAQAFNAKTATELAAIGETERRIRGLATRAVEMSGRAGNVADPERPGLMSRVSAARAEADRAHTSLTDGLTAFRTAAAGQSAAVDAAVAQCLADPLLTAYESCLALPAEQAALEKNIATVTARYEVAETGWRQDRARLEEASAVIALGR